ncbi:uncharacterized protein EV420DRAFT_1645012 [Desarmillaria tabescens]|uniref:Uncharacterized protein n=1 Tax=Armillaria tabescens TaxID=1929756 RepID=A0AA39N1L5_ARMTA|nr:uncharacterized protein EV420DRAFT_1645012 [Desarmillaria tabescens]KAK0454158.1 hypothetical protein EV420DRAFT_1645012 [Desarmillaria tabescens]
MFSSKLTLFVSTLVSLVAATTTTTVVTGAAAAPTSVQDVLNSLKTTTDAILPQIDALVANKTATNTTVAPLLNQVISAVDTATSSIFSQGLAGSNNTNDLATLASGIMKDINTSMQGVKNSGCHLDGLLAVIAVTLTKLLCTLEVVVPGLLKVVALLLKGVVGTVVVLLCGLLGVIIG